MRNPHFFKTYCRIGVNNYPYGQKSTAHGVEDAPDFILTKDFLKKFKNYSLSDFQFSIPEKFISENYYNSVLTQTIHFKMYMDNKIFDNKTLVVVGGDHFVTFPSLLYDLKKHGTGFGIIHFDSHGDINSYESSPSKNLHGMYLRILFDNFDLERFDHLVPKKMPTKNLLFIGDVEFDEDEREFVRKNKFKVIESDDMKNSREKSLKIVEEFVNKFNHIHISFDVDVFKKEIVSATTTPSQKGFEKKEIFDILEIIKRAKSLTLDVAEVNPSKKGAAQTIKITQEIITTVLS